MPAIQKAHWVSIPQREPQIAAANNPKNVPRLDLDEPPKMNVKPSPTAGLRLHRGFPIPGRIFCLPVSFRLSSQTSLDQPTMSTRDLGLNFENLPNPAVLSSMRESRLS